MRVPFMKNRAVAPGEPAPAATAYIQLDRDAIETVFVAPKWLRDIGLTSWFAVGAALLLLSVIGLLAITSTIVVPVIIAGVVAAVAAPVVSWFQSKGLPRGAGTIITVLLFIAVLAAVGYAVMSGVVSQADESSRELKNATTEITNWLSDHGIDADKAQSAQSQVESGTTTSVKTLMNGVIDAIGGLTSIVFMLAMIFISLVFLLKDGPIIRAWGERHMGVPQPVAHIITGRVIGSLRGYFFGVTIIALFNAAVVGLGAWALGVPLVATIAVVTFVCAYVPFIGAWAAGAFGVLMAFGADNDSAVAGMIIITLLANGLLQQLVQPIAYGAALGIHPLAALVATIGAGCLFGSIGLILGAPMVSAAVRISSDLANARAEQAETEPPPPSESPPLPAT